MAYTVDEKIKQKALELYKRGFSSQEVKENLGIIQGVRQIQRWTNEAGITRDIGDAFRLAVKKGRVKFHTTPNKVARTKLPYAMRFKILHRDGFKCVLCGATANDSRLQVDHKDNNPTNNNENNLQVLCEECNKGKSYNSYSN